MAIELLRSFLEQATASGSRSTVLTDLRWFAGILASALLIAFKIEAAHWMLVFIASLLGIVAIVYIATHIYFGIKSPDYLRSERFTLSKLAIEKSITGDNLSGLIDPENPAHQKRALQIQPSITEEKGP